MNRIKTYLAPPIMSQPLGPPTSIEGQGVLSKVIELPQLPTRRKAFVKLDVKEDKGILKNWRAGQGPIGRKPTLGHQGRSQS